MGRLPSIKRILREDLKDAPPWVSGIIDPLNNFMQAVYTALNNNITFSENVASFIKEVSYTTPSGYPVMDDIKFTSTLKTKATSVLLMQAYERSTYRPPPGPVYIPWIEDDGMIIVSPVTGLEAGKTYILRLLVS